MTDSMIWNLPDGSTGATLLLAHGAGAPMDSPFMELLAKSLAAKGLAVARFEFPYMAQRWTEGRKRPPDRMPQLLESFRMRCEGIDGPLFIGGKSMGGRVASMVADVVKPQGLVCFGYPFHPPGKPEKTRTDHLETLSTPALILQGTRDPLGKPDEVAGYTLSSAIEVHWLESGDHDFKPLRSSGLTQLDLIEAAALAAVRFCLDGIKCD